MAACAVCGRTAKVRGRRCRTCYRYWRNVGKDRPAETQARRRRGIDEKRTPAEVHGDIGGRAVREA